MRLPTGWGAASPCHMLPLWFTTLTQLGQEMSAWKLWTQEAKQNFPTLSWFLSGNEKMAQFLLRSKTDKLKPNIWRWKITASIGVVAYMCGATVDGRAEWNPWALVLDGSGVHSDNSPSCPFCLGHLAVCSLAITVWNGSELQAGFVALLQIRSYTRTKCQQRSKSQVCWSRVSATGSQGSIFFLCVRVCLMLRGNLVGCLCEKAMGKFFTKADHQRIFSQA